MTVGQLKNIFAVVCIIVLFGTISGKISVAQDKKEGFIIPATFGRSFIADMTGNLIKVDIGYGTRADEYDLAERENEKKVYVKGNLGFSIPLYLKHFYKNDKQSWSLAFSVPFNILIWADSFEQITTPLLNTDVRYGLMEIRAIKYFSDGSAIRNLVFKLLPYNHESSHIGDELAIYRDQQELSIVRVNVSYEYSELAVTINDPDNSRNNNHAFKGGFLFLLDYADRWYVIGPAENDNGEIKSTEQGYEYYFQYQFQRATGFLTGKNIMNVLSLEIRNRVRFGYELFDRIATEDGREWITTPGKEERIWCLNSYFGWRFYPSDKNFYHSVGTYLRVYSGLNPHGQFRNRPSYNYFGFSLVFEI
jgi:hypothetical protein